MKAIQTSQSIRPISGRALVRVSYCSADTSCMPSTYPSNLLDQSLDSMQAHLWFANSQACEDRVPPGGGSA